MGQEKKGDNDAKKEEEKKEKEEEEIVLKVEMHCEACARKIAKTLKGFQGVEEVATDIKASKVVVKGKGADSIKVYERLQKKSGKKVELISPLPKPEEKKKEENKKEEEKKEEPPAVATTAVLKIRMHCEACAQVLRKRILKIKGVEFVQTNLADDQVMVKGIIDPGKLVEYVYKRTGKHASIVKDEEKKEDDKKEEKKESEDGHVVDMIQKSEFWTTKVVYSDNANPFPEIFSDENPHACSVM